MKALSLIFLLYSSLYSLAQQTPPSQADLEAMLKKIQHQKDSLMNDPKFKKAMTGQPGLPGPNNNNVSTGGTVKFDRNLPPRDTVKIRSIPKKNFTLEELGGYLSDLHNQLKKKLPPDAVSSANAIAQKLGNDPAKLEAAAMQAWQKGATEEAILLVTNGASRDLSDGLLLTNAGALLDMSGLSEKAVPVLRTIVSYDPENAIALNNLGQAFTALGMQDSAMYYFGRCLGYSPQHPEANNTAGVIELKKGNKAKAQSYFENSIRGGFNLTAHLGIRTINSDNINNRKIGKLIRPKVKLPEYFNQFKYKLPPQCRRVDEAPELDKAFSAYRSFLSKLRTKYEKLRKQAEQDYASITIKKLQQNAMNPKGNIVKPFLALGGTMLSETTLEFTEDLVELEKFNNENRQQYKALELEHSKGLQKLVTQSSGGCEAMTEFNNKYLELLAQLNDEWQTRNLALYKKFYDDLVYWSYLGSIDDNEFRIKFYDWTDKYILCLYRLCQSKIIQPCRAHEPEETEKPIESELSQFDCPVEIEIPFIVGEFSLDCEKFSFSAGEGLVFKYEKNFTGQRQSTMSLGIGVGIYAMKTKSIAGVKGGAKIGADMSVFLVFDNMGHLTDGGMQYGAKASAGIAFSAGEKIKIKKDIIGGSVGFGWRFGTSSGISFDEPAPLKNLFIREEVQQNRNVRIYNSN